MTEKDEKTLLSRTEKRRREEEAKNAKRSAQKELIIDIFKQPSGKHSQAKKEESQKVNFDENDRISFGSTQKPEKETSSEHLTSTQEAEVPVTENAPLRRVSPHHKGHKSSKNKGGKKGGKKLLWLVLALLLVVIGGYFFLNKSNNQDVSAQEAQDIVARAFTDDQSDLTDQASQSDMNKLAAYAKSGSETSEKQKYARLAKAGKQALEDRDASQDLKDMAGLYKSSVGSDASQLKNSLSETSVETVLPTYYAKRVKFYNNLVSKADELSKLSGKVDNLYNSHGKLKQSVSEDDVKDLQDQLADYQAFAQAKTINKKLTKALKVLAKREDSAQEETSSEEVSSESSSEASSSESESSSEETIDQATEDTTTTTTTPWGSATSSNGGVARRSHSSYVPPTNPVGGSNDGNQSNKEPNVTQSVETGTDEEAIPVVDE
ncbi:hypothetical protein [Ligilactobacillus equi]